MLFMLSLSSRQKTIVSFHLIIKFPCIWTKPYLYSQVLTNYIVHNRRLYRKLNDCLATLYEKVLLIEFATVICSAEKNIDSPYMF